jgi:hypothetical protein
MLTGYQEATPAGVSSSASGTFSATIDDDASPPTITYTLTYVGIIPTDVIGPASQGIGPGDFGKLVDAIRSGVTYVNVHTPMFPAGEIRGQINNDDQRQVP